MTDDELRLTRRHFLQRAAVASALTGGVVGMVLTTDAKSEEPLAALNLRSGDDSQMYPYF